MKQSTAIMDNSMAVFLLVWIALGLAACSSVTKVESDLGMKGAPDWVNEGSQALDTDKGRFIHGIGSAPRMGDASLQSSTADDRARAEVARVLSSYMDVVSNDYLASATMGDSQVNEQVISRQIQNVTDIRVVGMRNIGRWRDDKSGDLWSIFELDLEKFNRIVQGAEAMDPSFKQHFQENGETLFDRYVKEN